MRPNCPRTVVRARFAGIVAKRFHNPGDTVDGAAGDPVLRVIDPRRLQIVSACPWATWGASWSAARCG